MSGRFTTTVSVDDLVAFLSAQPDALRAPEALAAWSSAWAFLTGETDVVLTDETSASLQRPLASGEVDAPPRDAILRLLLSRQSQQARRYGADTPPPPTPWRLDVGREAPTDPGVLTSTPEALPGRLGRRRAPVSHALRARTLFPPALDPLRWPTSGLVVVDPYLLSRGHEGLADSFAPLVEALVPDEARGDLFVLVLTGVLTRSRSGAPLPEAGCQHVNRWFQGQVGRARQAIEQALARRMPRVSPRVSLVVRPEDINDYHDRHVFTGYGEIHAGRSADVLLRPRPEDGRSVVRKTTTLDAFTVFDAWHRRDTAERLERIREIVRRADPHEAAGPRHHPLFDVLPPLPERR